ncbi:MarR family transcriptional regulator [Sphingomonas sp. LB2R24]|uniref:MarR family winged helix-turn-helix transcriptional regulator n=1 Tax=Sphingomonas sorbitolis TaxID=3096165 RepID=UPI002FC87FBE
MDFYTTEAFGPDCSLGFLARRINQGVQGALEPLFAVAGPSVTQWSAMVSIWFGRANTCADLARDLAHDRGATTRLVDTLEQQGWVTRTRATDDRRVVNLMLTPEGTAVTLDCRDRAVAYWNRVLVDWDRSEVETMIGLMQKLRGTLESAAIEDREA